MPNLDNPFKNGHVEQTTSLQRQVWSCNFEILWCSYPYIHAGSSFLYLLTSTLQNQRRMRIKGRSFPSAERSQRMLKPEAKARKQGVPGIYFRSRPSIEKRHKDTELHLLRTNENGATHFRTCLQFIRFAECVQECTNILSHICTSRTVSTDIAMFM